MSNLLDTIKKALETAKTDEAKAVADVTAAVHSTTGFVKALLVNKLATAVVFGVGAIVGGLTVHVL